MAHPRAVVVVVVTAALVGGWWVGATTRPPLVVFTATVIATRDGDTVIVELPDGTLDTVRLLGIDTPETHHPTRPVGCLGPEASAYTAAQLTGRTVRLELDVQTRDRYGRLLAQVYVDGRWFNRELVSRGLARVLVIPPNGAHGRSLLAAEIEARDAGRGVWGLCGPEG